MSRLSRCPDFPGHLSGLCRCLYFPVSTLTGFTVHNYTETQFFASFFICVLARVQQDLYCKRNFRGINFHILLKMKTA